MFKGYFAVLPAAQNKGIGGQLLDYVEKTSIKIRLETITPTIYLKRGYK